MNCIEYSDIFHYSIAFTFKILVFGDKFNESKIISQWIIHIWICKHKSIQSPVTNHSTKNVIAHQILMCLLVLITYLTFHNSLMSIVWPSNNTEWIYLCGFFFLVFQAIVVFYDIETVYNKESTNKPSANIPLYFSPFVEFFVTLYFIHFRLIIERRTKPDREVTIIFKFHSGYTNSSVFTKRNSYRYSDKPSLVMSNLSEYGAPSISTILIPPIDPIYPVYEAKFTSTIIIPCLNPI